MLKIGYNPQYVSNDILSEFTAKWTSLPEAIETDFIPCIEMNSFDTMWEYLVNEQIDVAIYPISKVPIGGAEELSTAALLSRMRPQMQIKYHKGKSPVNHLVELDGGDSVLCPDANIRAQCSNLLQGIVFMLPEEEPNYGQLSGTIYYPSGLENQNSTFDLFESSFDFNPRELIPPTGQNILSVICRKSETQLREQLITLNDQEVSRISNVERRILKLLTESGYTQVHAYTETDINQNYHVFVCCFDAEGNFRTVKHSNNISTGIENEIIKLLTENSL